MGQSLSQLYVHLTFGTKGRHPFISEEIESELYAYMAGVLVCRKTWGDTPSLGVSGFQPGFFMSLIISLI